MVARERQRRHGLAGQHLAETLPRAPRLVPPAAPMIEAERSLAGLEPEAARRPPQRPRETPPRALEEIGALLEDLDSQHQGAVAGSRFQERRRARDGSHRRRSL